MDTTRIAILGVLAAISVGCATPSTYPTITVNSQPEGAYITERANNTGRGIAPIRLKYDAAQFETHRDAKGCFVVHGFDAKWASGAESSLTNVRMCGSSVGSYQITISRPASAPGLDRDLQVALQLQAARAQQAAADSAATNAGLLAIMSGLSEGMKSVPAPDTSPITMPGLTPRPVAPATVHCTSTRVDFITNTTCR